MKTPRTPFSFSLRRLQKPRCLGRVSPSRSCFPLVWCRNYSTSNGPPSQEPNKLEALRRSIIARPPQLSWDVMSPTNSALLNIALNDYIPLSCQARAYQAGARGIETYSAQCELPEGHHLVYFPLQKTAKDLLADGTDPFPNPGYPYVRRMWAGGSIEFNNEFRLDSKPVVCKESIDDVTVKGTGDNEKIFVDMLRVYTTGDDFKSDDSQQPGSLPTGGRIRERRVLVFLRESPSSLKPDTGKVLGDPASNPAERERVVKAPNAPDFSITLTPTPTLLFQYSALTFNAHAIHLDPQYCREVEGRRGLLVHGPLSLTLMLSVLRSRLSPGEKVRKIDYRNLAPLYVNEPIRVCIRSVGYEDEEPGQRVRKWELWVEGKDGGLSVRGTARTV
ncbi:hypothetical protein AAE478_003595 [Parahypoxylon ruwenzoriense]